MDAIVDEEAASPPKIPDAVRAQIFGNIAALYELEQKFNAEKKSIYRWIIGVLACLMVIFALLFAGKAAQPPQLHYAVIDNFTGRIYADISAKEAPAYFDTRTTMACLQEYVSLRQSYIWQTAEHDFHRVAIMSSPEEQGRFQEATEKAQAKSKYGLKGYRLAKDFFPPNGFTLLGRGEDQTEEWDVQFVQVERLPDQPETPTRSTARIWVQFHPELPMNWKDRNDDLCGTYVINYRVTP